MNKDNMGRNAEHYADPTPAAAMRNINKDERQKEAVRLDRIGSLVPLLRASCRYGLLQEACR